MKDQNILNYIIENKHRMTKKQQHLCDFLLDNYKDIGLMTVTELSEKADVGKTTVLRFTQELGYSSFFELKKQFYEIQKDYSDKWENVQSSFDPSHGSESHHLIYDIWNEEIKTLSDSLSPQLVDNFQKAVDLLVESKHIHLLGFRPYKPIAMYMESLMNEFEPDVHQLAMDADTILDRVLFLDRKDVILIIAFSPYATRIIDAAEIANKRNIPVILITDELSNPISSFADVILKLESNSKYFTVISIITLIEAMVVEYGRRQSPKSGENVKKLSNILKEKNYIDGGDFELNSKNFKD